MKDRDLEFWDEDEWKSIVKRWPQSVRKQFGSRLRIVQKGGHPATNAKALTGFKISVMEIWARSGQRIIYTSAYAQLSDCIFVLDAFEKDSAEGRKMRKTDRARIELRVKQLKERMDRLQADSDARRRALH